MYNLKVETFPNGMTRLNYYEYGISFESRKHTVQPTEINPFDGQPTRVVKDFIADRGRSAAVSLKRSRQMIYNYALSNEWDWFVTMTFDPKKVDRYDYDACVQRFKDFIDTCRRKNPEMRYIFVPELHKDGAIHFHGLLASCPNLEFRYSGKVVNKRRVFNLRDYKLGFTTATKVSDSRRSAGYLCKYITKELCKIAFGRKRYWASRNLELPEVEYAAVIFGQDAEEILDSIFYTSGYYKMVMSPLHGKSSHLFEFPDGAIRMENFRRWLVTYVSRETQETQTVG